MSFKEEYIFWSILNQLVSNRGYQIVTASEDQSEYWLEDQANHHKPFIRLKLVNLDWTNSLKKDLHLTAHNGEKIRKHLSKRNMFIKSIYVSPYAPVDDYSELEGRYTAKEYSKIAIDTMIYQTMSEKESTEKLDQFIGFDMNIVQKDEEVIEERDIESLRESTLSVSYQKSKEDQKIFSNGKPIFTYLFMALQVVVFFWLEMHGGSQNTQTLIEYGAKYNPLIIQGEWWRFFTPIFLHIGFTHLALNTLSLYFVGIIVERIFGNVRFLLIYLFAGFAGSIASFLFVPTISAGASGAIFGLLGALLYFGILYPKLFFRTMGWNIIIILIMNLALTFTAPSIDSAGHIGGLIGGFLAAGAVSIPQKRNIGKQMAILLFTCLLTIGALNYGYKNALSNDNYEMTVGLAQQYIMDEKYDKGYQLLKPLLERKEAPEAYFLVGVVELHKQDLRSAEDHFLTAIKQKSDFPQAYYNLGLIYGTQNQPMKAKEFISKAIQQDPENETYKKALRSLEEY